MNIAAGRGMELSAGTRKRQLVDGLRVEILHRAHVILAFEVDIGATVEAHVVVYESTSVDIEVAYPRAGPFLIGGCNGVVIFITVIVVSQGTARSVEHTHTGGCALEALDSDVKLILRVGNAIEHHIQFHVAECGELLPVALQHLPGIVTYVLTLVVGGFRFQIDYLPAVLFAIVIITLTVSAFPVVTIREVDCLLCAHV